MSKEQRVTKLLLKKISTDDLGFWYNTESRVKNPAQRKAAYNRFLFISIMDRGMRVEVLVEKADQLINEFLGGPENLWDKIRKTPATTWEKL